jgi:serine/threonine protein kinase
MSLVSGARRGPYEILSALGAGGMSEVYMARDTSSIVLLRSKSLTGSVLSMLFLMPPGRGNEPR